MSKLNGQLRVFFDAYELAPGAGKSLGIYNYAKNLLRALVEVSEETVEFVVACNGACAPDFDIRHSRVDMKIFRDEAPGKLARQLWLRVGAAVEVRRQQADVYFSPKGFLPNGLHLFSPRTRSVVVTHDLIPLWYAEHFPGYFGWVEELVVNHGLTQSILGADRIIAISQATATDIRNRLGRIEGVTVVHNGIPTTAPGNPPLSVPFIFAIASGLPHKNAVGVLEAYQHYRGLVQDPLPLVLCGSDSHGAPGVQAVRGLSDADLHGYYAHARLFVFLSRIEGFGFPPVEAMSHGTPVLCSDIPSLREVTCGAACYVSPDDPQSAAAQIAELLAGPIPDKFEIAKIAERYSWEFCARGILNVLRDQET